MDRREVEPDGHQRGQERRRRQLAEARREISTLTGEALDLEQVLAQILEQMAQALPFDTASIQLLNRSAGELAIIASRGFKDPKAVEALAFPLEETYPNARVWRRKAPQRYADVSQLFAHFADPHYHATQVRGWLGAPLLIGDRAIGVITLDSFTPDLYTSQHEHLAMIFAGQAAIAIQNACLFDSAQWRIRDLEIVNDIVQIIGTKLDTHNLLEAIASQIADKLKCTHCTLFFPKREGDELLLVPEVTHGVRGEIIMTRRFRPGEGLAGWVFQHGESLVLPDARQDPRFSFAREAQERPRSMLIAPIKVGDRTIGVISADQDKYNWFSESDRRLADALARQAGIAIERAMALALLHDIGKQIISKRNVDEILQQIVFGAIRLTNTTSGVIYLVGEDGQSVVKTYHQPPEFDHPRPRMSSETGLTRQVVQSGEIIIFPDVHQDPRVNPALYDRVKSMIAVPLKLDRVIGVLYLNDARPHNFTETEVSFLLTLATQAAIAIDNARLLQNTSEALEKRVAELETLQEIDDAITSTLELGAILQMILDRGLELTRACCGTVQLISEDGQELVLRSAQGMAQALIGSRVKLGEGLTGKAAQEGHAYYVADVQSPQWAYIYQDDIPDNRSALAVPMQFEGQVVGVIHLQGADANVFNEDDVRVLIGLARQAAIAIKNARLFDNAQRRIRDLEIISDIVQIISTKLDTQDLLQAIVSQIADKLKCTHCTLWFPQREGDELLLVPQVSHGVRPDLIMTRRFRLGEGLAGWAFQHGESVVLPDARLDSRFSLARALHERPRSMLVAPVKVGDRTIGVISADQEEYGWFSESDRRLVDALARQAGIAIERAMGLALLHDIGKRIIGSQAVDDILQQIVYGAIRLTNTTAGVIHLISEDGKLLLNSFQYPLDFDLPKPRLHKEDSVTRHVIRDGEILAFPDVRQDVRLNPVLYDRVRSIIAIPLKLDERKVIGVLYLNDANPHNFTETEVSLLSTLATQAAIAIRNAVRYKELEDARDRVLASEAVAWLGLFGAEWQHAINQKIFSIGNYTSGLRRWLNGQALLPSEATRQVIDVLDRIERVGESIGEVQFTSQVPAEMPGKISGRTVIDQELPEIVKRWCSGRDNVRTRLDGLNCPGIAVQIAPQWLKVAMEKLINNALKAMPGGGELTVATRLVGDRVHVTIKDTGQGIPEAVRSYFLKRAIPRGEGEAGTGMGTLIARFVALSHGGDLMLVDSRAGKGTELLMTLPVATPEEPLDEGGE